MSCVTDKNKIVVATTAWVLLSLSMQANSEETEVIPGMVVVPDSRLAMMRGKYASSTKQVVYFGVQMQSNWETPNGASLNAGATFSVNFTTATPTVSFVPNASIVVNPNGTELVDTTGRTVTSSGIANISGVTQSTQSAGDFNSTENLAKITFLSEIPPGEAMNISLDPVTNNGMTASSTLNDNSAVVHLEVDGQGLAEQSIRGTVQGAAGKGVYQTIVTLGDRHRVTNQLEMDVVLRNESEQFVQQQGLGSAISNLRGLTPGR